MPKFVLMEHTDGSESWINPNLVVEVRSGIPRDGRPTATIYLSGGFGRDALGTKDEIVRLLQS